MRFLVILAAALTGSAAWWYWFRARVLSAPSLTSAPRMGVIATPNGVRQYQAVVPHGLRPGAPIVVVLHGSRSSAGQMREQTGFEFERLAEHDGFIVAYPEGYGGYWNDCRMKGDWAAKRLDIDDVGFLRLMVQRLRDEHAAGPAFFVGFSNGGHMCFRMAFEAPDLVNGIAVLGANLPAAESMRPSTSLRPVSAMLISGTSDPINPYGGGKVTIFGFGDRGFVHSAPESAAMLASLLGADVRPGERESVVPKSPRRRTWVERQDWTAHAGDVALVTVHHGGHAVPQPGYRFPRILGRTEDRFSAPAACWTFFQRIIGRQD